MSQARLAPRRLTVVLLVGIAGLALVAAVMALAAGGRSQGAATSSDGGPYRGSEPPGRFELPSFELASYRGALVASRDLRGRVVLFTLLDSQCTDACPILASAIARAIDRLAPAERAQVRAIAVTVDPAGDTSASVRRFLRAQRAEGRIDYLVGSENEIRPLWNSLSILSSLDSGRDSLHSAPLRIYSREGVWVATLHAGADLSVENLLHDIRVALRPEPTT